jgi:hypothetical protein
MKASCTSVTATPFTQTQLFSLSAAEKNLHVTWSMHGSGAVNVTCKAQGVYPEPKMALYRDSKNKYVSRASF